VFANAVVNAFVSATQQTETVERCQLVRKLLIEAFATWRHEENRSRRIGTFNAVEHGLCGNEHSCSATKWRVIHAVVHIRGVFAQVVRAQINKVFFARAAKQAFRAEVVYQLRK
jgi:hypothetical protein